MSCRWQKGETQDGLLALLALCTVGVGAGGVCGVALPAGHVQHVGPWAKNDEEGDFLAPEWRRVSISKAAKGWQSVSKSEETKR